MADLGDLFTGTPPTYGVNMVGGGKSPLFDFAKYFGGYLKNLVGQPLPSYPGQIDPGMSPSMAGLGQMLQAFSRSPLPQVMGQAGGVLGRFMNPSFANPMARMQMGSPNYFGGQGGPMGNMGQPGMGGPMPVPPWMQPPGGMGGPPMGDPRLGGQPMDPGSQPFPMGPQGGGGMEGLMQLLQKMGALGGGGAPGGPTAMIPPGVQTPPSDMRSISMPGMTNTTGGPSVPPTGPSPSPGGDGMRSIFSMQGGARPREERLRNIQPPPPPRKPNKNLYMPKKTRPPGTQK